VASTLEMSFWLLKIESGGSSLLVIHEW